MSAHRRKYRDHRGIYERLDSNGVPIKDVWEIDYYDSSGVRRWETVHGRLRDAVARREELRTKKHRGERIAPARAPRLADFAAEWLRAKRSRVRPRTFEKYEVNLRVRVLPRLGRVRVSALNEDQVARLVRELEAAGLAGATVQGVLVVLSGLLGAA